MFLLTKHAAPHLRESEHGSVVNIASISGKRPLESRTPYVASKMTVIGMTRTWAFEFGDAGVTVLGDDGSVVSWVEDPIGDDAARNAVFQTRPSVVPDFRGVLDVLRSHVRRMLEAVDQLEELPPDDALAEALVVAIEAITVRPSGAPL